MHRHLLALALAATACSSVQRRPFSEDDPERPAPAAESRATARPPAPAPARAPAPAVVASPVDEAVGATMSFRRADTEGPSDDPSARLEKRPPPARRNREYLLAEKIYGKLMREYPLGFTPDDCTAVCRQSGARTKSDDGQWVWVLRCLLKRNLHDEPVVACREDALAPDRVPAPKSNRKASK